MYRRKCSKRILHLCMLYVCVCPICACTIDYWKPSLIHRFRSNIFFHRMFPNDDYSIWYSNFLVSANGSFQFGLWYKLRQIIIILRCHIRTNQGIGRTKFRRLNNCHPSFEITCIDWVLFFMQCASSRKCTWAQNYVNTERN